MRFLLDTNVVSEWVNPQPNPRVVRWLDDVDEDMVYLSVTTFAEIRRGIELMAKGRRRDRLSDWLVEDLPLRFDGRILGIEHEVADMWGIVTAKCTRAGRSIGVMDAFIAASAHAFDATLVTRNASDFEATGVDLLNPWSLT